MYFCGFLCSASPLKSSTEASINWKLPLMLPPDVCGCWLCCTLVCASSLVVTEFHISNMFNIVAPRDLTSLPIHNTLTHSLKKPLNHIWTLQQFFQVSRLFIRRTKLVLRLLHWSRVNIFVFFICFCIAIVFFLFYKYF